MARVPRIFGPPLVTDVTPLANALRDIGTDIAEEREESELDALIRQTMGVPDDGVGPPEREMDLSQLPTIATRSPQAARAILEIQERNDQQAAAQATAEMQRVNRIAELLLNTPFDRRDAVIQTVVRDNPDLISELSDLRNMNEDQQNTELRGDLIRSEEGMEVLRGMMPEPEEFGTTPITLESDGERRTGLVGSRGGFIPIEGGLTEPEEGPDLSDASGLRKEFTSVSKDFADQSDAYGRVLASAQEATAAGDMALIFNFMKVLDPGSTVREGEFDSAVASASTINRVNSLFQRAMTGERLTEETRADFVERAGLLFESAEEQQQQREREFTDLAVRSGIDPDLVVFRRARPSIPEGDATQVGRFTVRQR